MTSPEAQKDEDEVTSSEDSEKAKTRARCGLFCHGNKRWTTKYLKIIALMFYFITFYLMFGSATHFNCICHHCHVHFLSSLIPCRFRYILVEIEIYFYPLASNRKINLSKFVTLSGGCVHQANKQTFILPMVVNNAILILTACSFASDQKPKIKQHQSMLTNLSITWSRNTQTEVLRIS